MAATADDTFTIDDAREELDDNDGNPLVLLKHNNAKFELAKSKQDNLEYGFLYDEVEEEVIWNSPSTMSKERFDDTLNDLWEKLDDEDNDATDADKPIPEMDTGEFYDTVDLNNMIDREMAHFAFKWIKENMDVTAITNEDESGDVLQYQDGIWTDNGAMAVKNRQIDLLQEHSSTRVSKELLDNYLKTRRATNVDSDKLGLDDGYVAVENGLLDLANGEIVRDLKPNDYAITQVPWAYDPDAECEAWEKFISESVENGKQDLLQEYVGYCLLRGEYPYAKALMLLGDGRNGKTTFLDVVEKLLGSENTMNADLSELAGGRFSAYRLEGKLANINADIEDDEITATSMFKNMTGGDSFQVEQKYGDPYDHQNSAKLIFASNSIPSVDTQEHAFYRRWLLVQFPHTFTTRDDDGNPDADPELASKLEAEMEGILAWAVEGYQRLLANNGQFTNAMTPEEVREEWYSYANPMAEFCRNYLYEDANERFTPTAEIFEAYEQFMEDQPRSPVSKGQLTSYIKKKFENEGHHGIKKNKDRESIRAFGSVHVRNEHR
jgi:putative DNA primase/helicase